MAIHCIVKGKVQGVWYRQSTLEKASQLGITGWVRNKTNGDVELVACGDELSLSKLKEWLWQGPPMASVTEVLIENYPEQTFVDFLVYD